MRSPSIRATAALLGALCLGVVGNASAFSGGIDTATANCSGCHTAAQQPFLGFAGDLTILRGTSRTYTFTIETGGTEGGLHISENGALSLSVGGASSSNTRAANGIITHSSPRNFGTVDGREFTFVGTASASAACGTLVTVTSWGVAANNDGFPSNDAGALRTDSIRIVCPPTITTNASPDITLGSAGQLTDTATVTGRSDPVAGATINFRLYGPDDATCSGPIVFQSLGVPYPVGGGTVTSAGFTPTEAGTYRWRATYSGDANNPAVTGVCDDPAESVLVRKASPSISTTASTGITLGGGQVFDRATVSGRVNATGPATIVFRLYGPDDATCATTPVFQSAGVSYPNGGGSVNSPAFTPTAAGTYRWRATYSGDANNNAVAGVCNAANESVVVAKAVPTLSTQASPPITLGAGQITDTATVAGRVNPSGGTIDFTLYGPDDAGCTAAPAFVSAGVPLASGGIATSAAFTPTLPGVYRWRASYSGDANNVAVAGACNDANENVTVSTAPMLTTSASPNITLGAGQLADTATVSGLFAPQSSATVDFHLHGPGDVSCAGTPVFISAGRPLSGGTAVSGSYTPTATGTYRWRAFYSGDANNPPVAAPCNSPNESVTVNPASPTITTTASPGVTLGGQVFDTAVVSGRVQPLPSASIDFRLYGPLDTLCTGAPVFESLGVAQPITSGPVISASFTPTAAGTYRWRAFYSGDANNFAADGACNAAGESVVVTGADQLLLDGFE